MIGEMIALFLLMCLVVFWITGIRNAEKKDDEQC